MKSFFDKCVQCNRKNSLIVEDNTLQDKGLGQLFEKIGTVFSEADKDIAIKVAKIAKKAFKYDSVLGRS